MIIKRCAAVMLLGVCFPLLSSCARLVYVESSISSEQLAPPKREITSTEQYKAIAGKVTKVALRAPENCSGQSASASGNYSDPTKSFIRSECGVEMGLLERQLTEAGYSVYSWKILDSMVKDKRQSYLEAARELGAEVFFSVNSLEGIVVSRPELIKRSYYSYSEKEGKGLPLDLVEEQRQGVRQVIGPFENESFRNGSFGAFLDATAIEVSTGQAVWFYKSGSYDSERASKPISFVVAGKKRAWWLHMVDGVLRSSQRRMTASSEYGTAGGLTLKPNSDRYYERYIKEVVADFVAAFKSSLP